MVKQSLDKRKRGRPKGSKNKKSSAFTTIKAGLEEAIAYVQGDKSKCTVRIFNPRYSLKTRTEKDTLDADQEYYFIYDLNRGEIYPEIIARFTAETEARLCVEFLNETRKISEKEFNKKRLYIL